MMLLLRAILPPLLRHYFAYQRWRRLLMFLHAAPMPPLLRAADAATPLFTLFRHAAYHSPAAIDRRAA